MVEIFSLMYYVWVILAIAIIIGVYYLFKDKTNEFKFRFLFGLSIFAWVIHFSRYWLDPDLKMYTLFFEDFCGFNTMLLPFLLLSKNKLSKDIMYFVAALFAAHSLFYPNNIEGDPIFYFNTIRFFFAHLILVGVPVWLVAWKMHTPNVRNIPYFIIYVLIGALYCFTMSVVFVETGLVTRYINYMGLWGRTDSVYRVFEAVAPFFRYIEVIDGEEISRPIPFLYMIPGLILYYVPVWVLMSFPAWKRNKESQI